MPSPRWRKQSKALRRAQSPIMLSLNLPQILMVSTPITAGAAGAQKGGLPRPKGRPQIGGTMPKSHAGRNAAEGLNRRFPKGFAQKPPRCPLFAKILEMAVRQARQRYVPARGVQKPRNRRPGDHRADR